MDGHNAIPGAHSFQCTMGSTNEAEKGRHGAAWPTRHSKLQGKRNTSHSAKQDVRNRSPGLLPPVPDPQQRARRGGGGVPAIRHGAAPVSSTTSGRPQRPSSSSSAREQDQHRQTARPPLTCPKPP